MEQATSKEPIDSIDPLEPHTQDLRAKSKVFPPSYINMSAYLLLKMASNDILTLSSTSMEFNNLTPA